MRGLLSRLVPAAFVALLAAPAAGLAQEPLHYAFGAGLNVDGVPSFDGQHVFGGVVFPTTPIPGVGARVDASLFSGRLSDGLTVTGNLRAPFLVDRSIVPYVIGGGGFALNGGVGFAARGGVGAETRVRDRSLFLELGWHMWGTRRAQEGALALSLGTLF